MSRASFELSAAARLDLLRIWNYLAENASLEVADKVVADIESAIRTAARSPGAGHTRPDLTSRDILFYHIHSYLVIYRPDKRPLHVLRVLHAARNVKSILEE
ncbi:MAG: type II toxin-antitoxin system RelE/ParE family toxin [Tepidisphaerales bacterium]